MIDDSPNALNYLEPHKRLSQRIAIAQLRGEPIAQLRGNDLSDDEKQIAKQFLVDERFLSDDEAKYFKFVANLEPDENKPSVIVDLRNFTFNFLGVSNQNLFQFLTFAINPNLGDEVPIPVSVLDKILEFIDSPSNQPPWSLAATMSLKLCTDPITRMTWKELNERIAPLATKIKENGSLFRVLQPSKKLSQLITETWMNEPDGDLEAKSIFTEGNSEKVNGFLLERGLLSKFDAQHATNIIVDKSQRSTDLNSTDTVYVGELTVEKDSNNIYSGYKIKIPYPEKPTELINNDQLLAEWVNSPDDELPFTPINISRFIPLTC